MKRILIVTAVFTPEPVVSSTLVADLASSLAENYQVTVIRPRPTRPMGFKQPDYDSSKLPYKVVTIESYTCPKSSLLGRFKECYSFGKAAAEFLTKHHKRFDFIYNAAWPLYGKYFVAKAAVRYGIPYVSSVQDIYPESITSKLPKWGWLKALVNKLFFSKDYFTQSNAKAVHTISDSMADYLSETRKQPREKYIVVRNWQNEQDFINYRESNPLKGKNADEPFTFMYLGNIGPLAGLEIVIEAFKNTRLDNARLVIAGSGSAKEFLKHQASGNDKIEFWEVPAGKVPATQDKADVMILPIKKGYALSSIPSKLPAYMFSGKPILCSVDKDSDTAKCIYQSNGGWVVEPENPVALSEAMGKCIMTTDNELKQLGKASFDFAIENLSRKKGLDKLSSILRQIIKVSSK